MAAHLVAVAELAGSQLLDSLASRPWELSEASAALAVGRTLGVEDVEAASIPWLHFQGSTPAAEAVGLSAIPILVALAALGPTAEFR